MYTQVQTFDFQFLTKLKINKKNKNRLLPRKMKMSIKIKNSQLLMNLLYLLPNTNTLQHSNSFNSFILITYNPNFLSKISSLLIPSQPLHIVSILSNEERLTRLRSRIMGKRWDVKEKTIAIVYASRKSLLNTQKCLRSDSSTSLLKIKYKWESHE